MSVEFLYYFGGLNPAVLVRKLLKGSPVVSGLFHVFAAFDLLLLKIVQGLQFIYDSYG
jgi:hypothetical protein